MKKLDKKTFNILKVTLILVAVFACGIYYLLFYDDFCKKLPTDEISFEITIEEETKKYVKNDIKETAIDKYDKINISTESYVEYVEEIEEEIKDDLSTEDESKQLKININTASSDLLQEIPNIGPTIASKIIEYREENGPFKNIEDIMNVKGIGQAKFNIIKEEISVHD